MKPNVLIALATGILGGPGKGLVQFLRYGGAEACAPVVIDYHTGRETGETEFEKAVRATGAPLARLHQRSTFDLGLVEQALTLVKEHGITILQSHGYKSHVLCWLLRRKTGLPWIAWVHGWTRENLRVRAYTALEHIMLTRADTVVAVSESLRDRLLPQVKRRALVIPNAVSPDELQEMPGTDVRRDLGIAPDALTAGVVGRLSPEKGQAVFLKALAEARQREPRLTGLLIGGGQEEENLRRLVRELGLESCCYFSGHVRGMAPWYAALDIQVMPSFTEGMPNAALEGMHMGLPLIASRVGGIPEVVIDGETGILLPPGDERALADALLRLATDADTRTSLGNNGRERVRREFDPAVRVRRILAIYDTILGNGSIKEKSP